MTTDRDWTERALCARLSPRAADRLFYVEAGRGNQRNARRAARWLCDQCPAQYDCLADALAVPASIDRHGIRGGLTPNERATLRDLPTPRDKSQLLAQNAPWVGGVPKQHEPWP